MSETGIVNIRGFPGYQITSDGRVFSEDRLIVSDKRSDFWVKGKELKAGVSRLGYKTVFLGRGNPKYVHRLVAENFIGPCPNGQEVRHLDGNPLNNHISNLAYGTRKENAGDAIEHGTIKKGDEHYMAKLSGSDVQKIKAMDLSKYGACTALANELGVSATTILDIKHGRTWNHV